MLTRDQILAADDLKREEVAAPEWGGSVFVRTMTAAERDRFEASIRDDATTNVRARLIVATACDDAGQLLFTEADVAALTAKSTAPSQRLFNAALRLNRITKADVEELEGNSGAIPSDSSPSGSPASSGS